MVTLGVSFRQPASDFADRLGMKNILIIRRDNIGDLVCTTPLIEGVKIAYPDAKVYLLINKVSQDVVKNNPHLEKVFVYKRPSTRRKMKRRWAFISSV